MQKTVDYKYRLIQIDLESKIKSGHFLPGDKIPGENTLADQYGVSVITSRKALDCLAEEGYIYRLRGKGSFVSDKTAILQINSPREIVTFISISCDLSDSSTMQLIKGAHTVFSEKNKALIVEYSKDRVELESNLLEKALEEKSGVLLFSCNPEKNIFLLSQFAERGLPLVLIDRGPQNHPFNLVTSFNLDGGYAMGAHLLELGHTKILFLGTDPKVSTEQKRLEGLRMAFNIHGDTSDKIFTRFDFAENPRAFLEDLELYKPTAIMCANDYTACTVTKILSDNGLEVPADISVTGFDDADVAKFNSPTITTIRQDFFEMGKKAAALILELSQYPKTRSREIHLPVELIKRDSAALVKENRL